MNPQDSAVWCWLRDVPCATVATPPDTAPSTPLGDLTRKRIMTARSTSPAKRQRILDDNESASGTVVTHLTESTRLSYRSSSSPPERAMSPVRDFLYDLRASKPAVICELPYTIPLPDNATALCTTLTQGLHERVIPIGLKDRISASFPLMANDIPNSGYDDTDNSSDRELDMLWHTITVILSEARASSRYQKDESAWCTKVVYPMLHLASKGSMLKAENVQSQTINPELLPIMPKDNRVQKKCNYAFYYHEDTQQVSDLYDALVRVQGMC